ncbi:MAG: hypothetical protein KDA85_07130, partial [Planctomycetaceae bacterium]|nr:hypothetical protein [Planctomycetaceae bacterium]
TQFFILVTDGVNDPPINAVPGLQQIDEDTTLVFSTGNSNAISVSDADVRLGNNRLLITLTATHGTLTLSTINGLAFTVGDGTDDASMTFEGDVADLNAALAGLVFTPDPNWFGHTGTVEAATAAGPIVVTSTGHGLQTGDRVLISSVAGLGGANGIHAITVIDADTFSLDGTTGIGAYNTSGGFGAWTELASVTITTDDQGQLTGPPSLPEMDTDIIDIIVNPVNDKPTFTLNTGLLATLTEDDPAQTVAGFLTAVSAGPLEEPPQVVNQIQVTVTGTTGSWNTTNFFSAGPAIDLLTGDLTYTLQQDANGTATVQVVLIDDLGLASDPQSFTITVNAVNDVPVFSLNPSGVTALTVDEDAGQQNVNLISAFDAARSSAFDELGNQPLTWILGSANLVSGNLLFDVLSIDPDGTFHFKSRQDTAGVATVTLQLNDNQAANNLSLVQTLTITVNPVNDPPVAITGSYVIDEGDNLILDGSSSYDVDAFFGDFLHYEWDLDNNGTFETSGDTFSLPGGKTESILPAVPWSYLQSLGLTAPAVYDIHLRVTDHGIPVYTDVADATLTTLIVDYGDAPTSYGTLKADSGAAHTIAGGLFLGATVDNELDGQPIDVLATIAGDGADEDGVAFPTTLERDDTLALPTFVEVTSSGTGKLDVWADWNQDGIFQAAEHLNVANSGLSFDVVAGVNRIDFTVPAGALVGTTQMRFRLSSAGNLAPTGRADDGEVEDYTVSLIELQAPVTPTIYRPVDFDLGDMQAPETSDLTPHVEWTLHSANYTYDLIIRNKITNAIVFQQLDMTAVSADVTPNLAAGTYQAEVIAYNRAGTAAAPATWDFKVVPLVVSSPGSYVVTSRPTIVWNEIAGTKTYTVELESVTTGLPVLTQVITTASVIPPDLPN